MWCSYLLYCWVLIFKITALLLWCFLAWMGGGKKKFYYFLQYLAPLVIFVLNIFYFSLYLCLITVTWIIGFFSWLTPANHSIMKRKPKYSSTLFITLEQCKKLYLCALWTRHLCLSSSMVWAIFTVECDILGWLKQLSEWSLQHLIIPLNFFARNWRNFSFSPNLSDTFLSGQPYLLSSES